MATADKIKLTWREEQVLKLLAEGLTNKGIARKAKMSEFTVNDYLKAIFRKLDAHSRTAAAVRAVRLGLI